MNELLRKLLFLPAQASTLARELDSLHYVVIGVTMLGSVVVVGLLARYVWIYRDRSTGQPSSDGQAASSKPSGTPIWLELTLIGSLLSLFTGFWIVGYGQFIEVQTPPSDAIPIYVSAKQWMWSFAYPGGAGSKGVLYVPKGQPVKLLLTSRDVIHSFFVPAFRIKQDAVPGRMTVAWLKAEEAGRHDVLCAEYCGMDHSRMSAEVVVISPEEFERRTHLDDPASEDADDLARRGRRIAQEQGCARCHGPDGGDGTGPSWVGLYGSVVELQSGAHVHADEAYLTRAMMDPLAEVRAPYASVMPSYQGVIDAGQVGALIEYIRSLRSHATRHSPRRRPGHE